MPNRRVETHGRFAKTLYGSRIFVLWCLFISLPAPVISDEIIMTTGEKFSSARVWEENGKIRFNMHGLIVSVDTSEVAQIIRSPASTKPALDPVTPQPSKPIKPAPQKEITPIIKPHEAPNQATRPLQPKRSTQPKKPDESAGQRQISGTGLQGIQWLAKPSDIPGLVKMEGDALYGGIDQYYQPHEIMRLGSAGLDGKVFGFWRDRLYTITMWVEGQPAYRRLQTAVFDRYGHGRQNTSGLERYVWTDPTSDRMLEFDSNLNSGMFWMRSRVLDERIKQLYPDSS